jgi:hypothetical protein
MTLRLGPVSYGAEQAGSPGRQIGIDPSPRLFGFGRHRDASKIAGRADRRAGAAAEISDRLVIKGASERQHPGSANH